MASLHTRSTRAALLAVVAASALVVSACGSSSSTTPTTSSAAAAGSAPVAATSGAMTSKAMTSGASASGGASSSAAATTGFVAPSTAAPTALTPAMISAAKATLANSSALTVCTSLPYPPFEVDDGSGKIVGFDIDFMNFVAKDLGIPTKIVASEFTAIKSGQAMKSKKCDIAAAAMTINAERIASIEFSNAYYDASQALMVLSSSSVKSLADLKGKKVGAQTGTTGLAYAQKYGDV